MTGKRPILAVALVLGIGAGWLLLGELTSIAGRPVAAAVLAFAPAVIGTMIWRMEGLPVGTTLAWTVPLGATSFAAVFLLESVLSVVVYLCTVAILVAMIFTERIPRWWLDQAKRSR